MPDSPERIDNCTRCVHHQPEKPEYAVLHRSECHRFPPVYDPVSESLGAKMSIWPRVTEAGWCGEFENADKGGGLGSI